MPLTNEEIEAAVKEAMAVLDARLPVDGGTDLYAQDRRNLRAAAFPVVFAAVLGR